MTQIVPSSHLADAHELESKGVRDLYKIELRDTSNTVLLFNAQNPVVWQGNTYESLPCSMTETAQNSTGEQSRPKFSSVNPDGLFSLWVQQGALDGAVFTRYRFLLTDLAEDNNTFVRKLWIMSKVISLNKSMLVCELRSSMDGVNFMLPARSFYPPAFPHVSLR